MTFVNYIKLDFHHSIKIIIFLSIIILISSSIKIIIFKHSNSDLFRHSNNNMFKQIFISQSIIIIIIIFRVTESIWLLYTNNYQLFTLFLYIALKIKMLKVSSIIHFCYKLAF